MGSMEAVPRGEWPDPLKVVAEATRIEQHFQSLGLNCDFQNFDGSHVTVDALMEHMTRDKKVKDGQSTFVMLSEIGKAFLTKDVDKELVSNLLTKTLQP